MATATWREIAAGIDVLAALRRRDWNTAANLYRNVPMVRWARVLRSVDLVVVEALAAADQPLLVDSFIRAPKAPAPPKPVELVVEGQQSLFEVTL